MSRNNPQIVLRRRPSGRPVADDFEFIVNQVPELEDGQVCVEVGHLGIDAFIRTTLEEESFHQGAQIGGVIPALGVGRIVESHFDGLEPGDHVFGPLCSQTYAVMPGAMLRKIDVSRVSPTAWLGALGLTTGLTAYVGMTRVAKVKTDDVVVVSAAAGAVGSMAGQIARLLGASKVIGIAGGPTKCEFLVKELGYHAAIDYRNDDVESRLRELAPQGIDVFFDNVGGDVLDAVLLNIKEGTRVVICGAISQYDDMSNVRGPRNYLKLAERHAVMAGFAVFHFTDAYDEGEARLADWFVDGSLVMPEHVEVGVERFPAALDILMSGGHTGKLLVKVSSD
ncbi:MAG: zinc-binding dehydrogenase [Ilumatobacteraceae bacterium]